MELIRPQRGHLIRANSSSTLSPAVALPPQLQLQSSQVAQVQACLPPRQSLLQLLDVGVRSCRLMTRKRQAAVVAQEATGQRLLRRPLDQACRFDAGGHSNPMLMLTQPTMQMWMPMARMRIALAMATRSSAVVSMPWTRMAMMATTRETLTLLPMTLRLMCPV